MRKIDSTPMIAVRGGGERERSESRTGFAKLGYLVPRSRLDSQHLDERTVGGPETRLAA